MSKKLTKDLVQDEAVGLSKSYNNLLLKHCTGLGKSLSFIKIQDYYRPRSVYIIVSEKNHIQNWIREYKKYKKEYLLDSITFFCYASIHKYINTSVDMICLDEGHHVTSEARLSALSTIKVNKIILLSATIKETQIESIEQVTGEFYRYNVPLKKAIEQEIIPTPTIYLIPLVFNKEYTETIEFTRGKKELQQEIYCKFEDRFAYMRNKQKYPNIKLIIQCSQFQKNGYMEDLIMYYKRQYFITRSHFFMNKWVHSGLERKQYLSNIKTPLVRVLLDKIKDKRFVCFCGSIPQAKLLTDEGHLVYSESLNNEDTITKFNNKELNSLFVIKMLQEGANLSDIEAGVIVQLDGDVGPFIQKSGRIMRSKHPEIYIFYYKDSRDEEYMDKVLTELDEDNVYMLTDLEYDKFNIKKRRNGRDEGPEWQG